MEFVIKPSQRKPPVGAPEGTVWSGGPVDRFRITLRISGEHLDPDRISALLRCKPSGSERKGAPVGSRIPKRGQWHLTVDSKDCSEEVDVEDAVRMLLDRLPSASEPWSSLSRDYRVDIFWGIFMDRENQGFGIPAEISRMLADRRLETGFDVYAPEI